MEGMPYVLILDDPTPKALEKHRCYNIEELNKQLKLYYSKALQSDPLIRKDGIFTPFFN